MPQVADGSALNMVETRHQHEVARGERFEFGRNWRDFLRTLNESRILQAQQSLTEIIEAADLHGRTFLDIGSGSGLFSLAACRLGARVHSIDYDPESVACTAILKDRFFRGDTSWTIAEGSVLDAGLIKDLGQFDIVYSWGVLHHTGQMWRAIDNAMSVVRPGGLLVLAIYNDEGIRSRLWHRVKRAYNRMPRFLRAPVGFVVAVAWEARMLAVSLLTLRFKEYARSWSHYHEMAGRGMSKIHDIIDWIGGYPFEVAKPDDVLAFGRARGFALVRLVTTRGLGCNEYVFVRHQETPA